MAADSPLSSDFGAGEDRTVGGAFSKYAGFFEKGGNRVKKTAWKNRIISATKAVGTYRDAFLPMIDTLANILAERDKIYQEYVETGAKPVVEHTNKNGSTNRTKNPLLVSWGDMNTSALSYWRDLGLTPAGLKKIDESAIKGKKVSALGDILRDLGG